jgi:hypothetical protein
MGSSYVFSPTECHTNKTTVLNELICDFTSGPHRLSSLLGIKVCQFQRNLLLAQNQTCKRVYQPFNTTAPPCSRMGQLKLPDTKCDSPEDQKPQRQYCVKLKVCTVNIKLLQNLRNSLPFALKYNQLLF